MQHNTIRLLSDELDSFYWMGFLLADGYFSEDKNSLSVEISEEDLDHLKAFAEYVSYNNKILNRTHKVGRKSVKIRIRDTEVVTKIAHKFDIHPRKTYNPPNIENYIKDFSEEQLLSLIVGYIDGDGSVVQTKNRVILQISVHKNWVKVLDGFKPYISNKCTIIIWKDMAILRLGVFREIKQFKRKAAQLNVPMLSRKWDRIDTNKVNQHEKSATKKAECLRLYLEGVVPKDISKNLNYDLSHVYKTINKNGIKK